MVCASTVRVLCGVYECNACLCGGVSDVYVDYGDDCICAQGAGIWMYVFMRGRVSV